MRRARPRNAGACAALIRRLSRCAGGHLSARPRRPPHATHRRPPRAAPTASPSVRDRPQRQLRDHGARLDPATARSRATRRSPGATSRPPPPPTLQFHLYYNAWRNTRSTWMRERRLAGDTELAADPESDWGWIDVTAEARRRAGAPGRCHLLAALHRAGRWQRGRSDGGGVPLAAPVAPGETINVEIAWSSRVPRTFARTGASATSTSSRSGFRRSACSRTPAGTATSSTPATEFFADFGIYDVRLTVPSGWMVGATGRRAQPPPRRRHDDASLLRRRTSTTSPGRRAPTTSSGRERSSTPACRRSRCGCCCSPSTRGQAERHFDATRAALKLLRRVVRRLSLRPHHDRRSGVAERRRRHGVPDALHRRHALAGARGGRRARGRDRPRGRPPVLVRHRRHQRVRARVDGRRASTRSRRRGARQSFEPKSTSKRFFGGFVPWVFRRSAADPRVDGTTSPAIAPSPRRRAVDADAGGTGPGTGRAITYNKTALWLHTLERMLGWPTLQRILSTYFTR